MVIEKNGGVAMIWDYENISDFKKYFLLNGNELTKNSSSIP